jgi:hypothetical protein
MTHTYAILEVSESTYREVAELLKSKGYGHCLKTTGTGRPVIDMHGIALAVSSAPPPEPSYTIDWREGTSDHPAHGGSAPYDCEANLGVVQRVLLDGADVSNLRICRLRTGRDGFIEMHAAKGGRLMTSADNGGDFVSVVAKHGHVVYEYNPPPTADDADEPVTTNQPPLNPRA